MTQRADYDPPGIGTVSPLRSKYAKNGEAALFNSIKSILESRGLIGKETVPPISYESSVIRFHEYVDKRPRRRHGKHWVDGGKQIVVLHPDTYIPFFVNDSGSAVCRLCNGEHSIGLMAKHLGNEWQFLHKDVLIRDLMQFLLLLEELDLIDLTG